uniref:Vasotocin receptor 2 n=1 Tax=Platynereis dumerilii TaxID=6359 RepID=A0A291FE84_PLADU|nr:vasotocin receptor 2 [Platynereis dumerilii]
METVSSGDNVIMDVVNISNTSSPIVYSRNEELAKIEITVQSLILTLAVFGNGVVLLVLVTQKKKLSRMNMMIAHLSLADLFVAFFNVLPQLIWDITFRFHGGDFLCRSVKFFQVVAMYASSYVLLTTAIDRYLAIVHPLSVQTWTSKKTHLMVAMAWLLSLLFSVPQLAIFSYQEIKLGSGVYDCWGVFHPEWTLQLYVTWITVAIYIGPFVLLVIAYGRICYVVWKSFKFKEDNSRSQNSSHQNARPQRTRSQKLAFNDLDDRGDLLKNKMADGPVAKWPADGTVRAHVRGVSRAKLKTVKLTLAVIACYLICWGPFFISQMWAAWDPNAPFSGPVMTINVLLASLNSCTNPWIYLIFTDNLCSKMHRIFSGKFYNPVQTSSRTNVASSFFNFQD